MATPLTATRTRSQVAPAHSHEPEGKSEGAKRTSGLAPGVVSGLLNDNEIANERSLIFNMNELLNKQFWHDGELVAELYTLPPNVVPPVVVIS